MAGVETGRFETDADIIAAWGDNLPNNTFGGLPVYVPDNPHVPRSVAFSAIGLATMGASAACGVIGPRLTEIPPSPTATIEAFRAQCLAIDTAINTGPSLEDAVIGGKFLGGDPGAGDVNMVYMNKRVLVYENGVFVRVLNPASLQDDEIIAGAVETTAVSGLRASLQAAPELGIKVVLLKGKPQSEYKLVGTVHKDGTCSSAQTGHIAIDGQGVNKKGMLVSIERANVPFATGLGGGPNSPDGTFPTGTPRPVAPTATPRPTDVVSPTPTAQRTPEPVATIIPTPDALLAARKAISADTTPLGQEIQKELADPEKQKDPRAPKLRASWGEFSAVVYMTTEVGTDAVLGVVKDGKFISGVGLNQLAAAMNASPELASGASKADLIAYLRKNGLQLDSVFYGTSPQSVGDINTVVQRLAGLLKDKSIKLPITHEELAKYAPPTKEVVRFPAEIALDTKGSKVINTGKYGADFVLNRSNIPPESVHQVDGGISIAFADGGTLFVPASNVYYEPQNDNRTLITGKYAQEYSRRYVLAMFEKYGSQSDHGNNKKLIIEVSDPKGTGLQTELFERYAEDRGDVIYVRLGIKKDPSAFSSLERTRMSYEINAPLADLLNGDFDAVVKNKPPKILEVDLLKLLYTTLEIK